MNKAQQPGQPYQEFLKSMKGMKGDDALEQCWLAMQNVFTDLQDPEETGWPKLRLAVQSDPDSEPEIYGD